MDVNFQINGVSKLLKQLEDVANIDIKEPMNSACVFVTAEAKNITEYESISDSGNLKNSITYEVYLQDGNVVGRIFSPYIYASYVEFGTGVKGNGTYPYSIKDVSLTYKSESWVYFNEKLQKFLTTNGYHARPFMYPAVYNNRERIRSIIATECIYAIKKAAA